MDFGLSREQELFQEALRGWLGEHAPMQRVRAAMEAESGRDDDLSRGLAAQGVCGILVSEELGGSGLGMLEAAIAAEELGRAATPVSFHTAAVMAPLALSRAGSSDQRKRWLAPAAAGEHLLSFALEGPPVVDAKLDGSAGFVADAADADTFVVCCGGESAGDLIVVPRDARGIEVVELKSVDETRRFGELIFDGVSVEDDMRLAAGVDIGAIVDAGRIALAADALGAAERSLELAVEYAMTRKQFGRVIGSFQAVKHMCAETAAAVEPVRSLLWYAAFAWDEGYPEASSTAALLKAHAAEVATDAVATCVQVFGGMGFTHECDMHVWFKRAGYDRQHLGGPAELREQAMTALLDEAS